MMAKKKHSGLQAWTIVLTIAAVVIGILSYYVVPPFHEWATEVLQSRKGIIIFVSIIPALLIYYWIIGFRGKSALYALALLVFTFGCILALANYDLITGWLEFKFGTWGMIGALLLIAALVYGLIRILL